MNAYNKLQGRLKSTGRISVVCTVPTSSFGRITVDLPDLRHVARKEKSASNAHVIYGLFSATCGGLRTPKRDPGWEGSILPFNLVHDFDFESVP